MKLFSILTISALLLLAGCASRNQSVKPRNSFEKLTKLKCTESFLVAKKSYDQHRLLVGLDVSNFFQASSMLETAKEKCKNYEYEDDVIFTLANSYFYIGDFSDSMSNYKELSEKFPNSSLNIGKNTAPELYKFLRKCLHDWHMNTYRKAEVYELHKEYENSRIQYELAKESSCKELKKKAEKKATQSQYIR